MVNKRVAIYARVSTTLGQNIDMQVNELTDYAKAREFSIVDVYKDIGISGGKDSRPALNRLLDDARERKFDVILVWKLDRFFRSLKHLINTLDELSSISIQFISLKDSFDLTTPQGKLLLQIIGAMGEFEKSLIQERVRAGIKNYRGKNQNKWGRPKRIDAQLAKELKGQGHSLSHIARQLGVTKSTVSKTLSKMRLNKELNNIETIDKCKNVKKVE